MTINNVMKKLDSIHWCIEALERGSGDVRNRHHLGQVHLDDTIELLKEYENILLNLKVDI